MSTQKKDEGHTDRKYSSSHNPCQNHYWEDNYQEDDKIDEIEFSRILLENKKQLYVQLLSGNQDTKINNRIINTGLDSQNPTDMENQNNQNMNNTSEKDPNVEELQIQDNSNYSTSISHFKHQTIIDINHENFINGIQKKAKKNYNQQQNIVDLQVQDLEIKDADVALKNQQINKIQVSANINSNLVTPDTIIYQQQYWPVSKASLVNSQPQVNIIEQLEIEVDRNEAHRQLTYLHNPTDQGIEQEDDSDDDYDGSYGDDLCDDDDDYDYNDDEDNDDDDDVYRRLGSVTVSFNSRRPDHRLVFYDGFQKGI